MGRNNICVIYDSDENYAKRLMSVINDDNDIPYNAQVFTCLLYTSDAADE